MILFIEFIIQFVAFLMADSAADYSVHLTRISISQHPAIYTLITVISFDQYHWRQRYHCSLKSIAHSLAHPLTPVSSLNLTHPPLTHSFPRLLSRRSMGGRNIIVRNLFCISANNASEHYRVNQFGRNATVHSIVFPFQLSSIMRYSVYMEVRLL